MSNPDTDHSDIPADFIGEPEPVNPDTVIDATPSDPAASESPALEPQDALPEGEGGFDPLAYLEQNLGPEARAMAERIGLLRPKMPDLPALTAENATDKATLTITRLNGETLSITMLLRETKEVGLESVFEGEFDAADHSLDMFGVIASFHNFVQRSLQTYQAAKFSGLTSEAFATEMQRQRAEYYAAKAAQETQHALDAKADEAQVAPAEPSPSDE